MKSATSIILRFSQIMRSFCEVWILSKEAPVIKFTFKSKLAGAVSGDGGITVPAADRANEYEGSRALRPEVGKQDAG